MYKETVDALNANIRTLAGGGLRATVEAICLDNKIEERNLEKKIDELAKRMSRPVAWLSASIGAPSLVNGTALYCRSALTAVGVSGFGSYHEYRWCDSRTVAMTPAVIADAMLVPLRLR